MKPQKLYLELEQLVERTGYTIRKERGTFQGDQCIVEGDQLVVINKKKPIEQQIGLLAKVLYIKKVTDIYIKPAVRKELDVLWDRFEKFDDADVAQTDKPDRI